MSVCGIFHVLKAKYTILPYHPSSYDARSETDTDGIKRAVTKSRFGAKREGKHASLVSN